LSDALPVAFSDLPEEAFPVKITGVGPDGAVLWTITVKPYVMVNIPGAPAGLEGKVSVRVKFATGEVEWAGPMSVEAARAYIEEEL
jgi:hypothetical protein